MEEAERCDRIAILHEGNLVAWDQPQSLKSEIGGDIILIEGKDISSLSHKIEQNIGEKTQAFNGSLRMESRDPHAVVAQILEKFKEEITSIQLSKPTLEDVFIQKTGHRFWADAHQERIS